MNQKQLIKARIIMGNMMFIGGWITVLIIASLMGCMMANPLLTPKCLFILMLLVSVFVVFIIISYSIDVWLGRKINKNREMNLLK
jgi:hypothetical protein